MISVVRWAGATLATALLMTAVPSVAADPYTIDVILPLTGGGAFLGTTQQKSLRALEQVVNRDGGIGGRPLQFDFSDDQTNPQTSVQLVNQAKAKHPALIMGSSLGALCKATQPQFESGPVDYCISPVITPEKGGWVFSASASGTDLILASVRYLRGRGWHRFATLNTTDASGQIGDNDIQTALKRPENRDMELVAAEHFNPSDTSVTAQVSRIKAANPQAIVVWAPGTPFGTALHGLSDVGLDVPVMTTSANMVVAQMKGYAGFIPSNVYFQALQYVAGVTIARDSPALRAYVAALRANGIPQDFQSGIAWDPAMIVVDALRKLGPDASAAELHRYLEGLKGYVGICGTYDFTNGNQRGLTVDDVLVMRWDSSKSDFVSVGKFGGLP